MSEVKSEFIEPKMEFRKCGPNPLLYHLVTEHYDGDELIFTYKYWSKRYQGWTYETKPAWEFEQIWRLHEGN